MVVLRLFAAAREAAGTGRDEVEGATVGQVLSAARARYGEGFSAVLSTSKVWVNGEPAGDGDAVSPGDEVAVLPPVSGGAGGPVVPGPGGATEVVGDEAAAGDGLVPVPGRMVAGPGESGGTG